ncbi:hypothetical protein CYLTODRAFT_314418, partial [Cylindrobasidium torrendii FP15055 ss-10]
LDNTAAIQATELLQPAPGHYLVDEFHKEMEKLTKKHPTASVTVQWVPGHMDVEGSEIEYAKKAVEGWTSLGNQLPKLFRKPLPASASSVKKTYARAIMAKWNR